MVVFGKNDFIRIKVVVFGQKWLYQAKWLYLGKVVVFSKNWLYSGKWFGSSKVVVFG